MKTYTESELQELLRQQRELCANEYLSDRHDSYETILNAPSPLLPTEEETEKLLSGKNGERLCESIKQLEEVGIKEDDLVVSVQPKDLASLASHSCTIGNSIQELNEIAKKEASFHFNEKYNKDAFWACVSCFRAGFSMAKESKKQMFTADQLEVIAGKNINTTSIPYEHGYIKGFWEGGIFVQNTLLNSDKNAKVSDTTGADSSNADSNKKIPSIDWEGLEEKFLKECMSLPSYYELFNWLKTKLQDYNK